MFPDAASLSLLEIGPQTTPEMSTPKVSTTNPHEGLCLASLSFAFGIGLYMWLPVEPPRFVMVMLGLAMAVTVGVIILKRFSQTPKSSLVWIIALCFMGGFSWIHLKTHLLHTAFIDKPLKDQLFYATITTLEKQPRHDPTANDDTDEAPTRTPKEKWRLTLDLHTPLTHAGHSIQRVRLKGAYDDTLRPGDTLLCKATLLPFSGAVSPYGYHFKRDYFFKGISATGMLKQYHLQSPPKNDSFLTSLGRTLSRFRYHMTQKLRTTLTAPYGEIAAALITGDRSGIPPVVRESFINSGIAHILAISGLHMGLLAAMVFFVVKRGMSLLLLLSSFVTGRFPRLSSITLSSCPPTREIAASITLMAMLGYLMLSGFGYPVIRSFIMTAIVMLALVIYRNPLSMRSLALAAFVIMIMWPESVLSASFLLSFVAVASLIAGAGPVIQRLYGWQLPLVKQTPPFLITCLRNIVFYGASTIMTTLIVTLATTPLTMALFNRWTLQAITGNILAVPLTAFWIMPAGIGSVLTDHPLFLTLFEQGLRLLCKIARDVGAMKGAILNVNTPQNWFYPLFLGGFFMTCLTGPYRRRFIGGLVCTASFMAFYNPYIPIGYVNRRCMGFYEAGILWVSSRSSFYTDQWRQHLGIDKVEVMPTLPLWVWSGWPLPKQPGSKSATQTCYVLVDQHTKAFKEYKKKFEKNPYDFIPTPTECLITNAFVWFRKNENLKKAPPLILEGRHLTAAYFLRDGTMTTPPPPKRLWD